jgi:hypothetical protein
MHGLSFYFKTSFFYNFILDYYQVSPNDIHLIITAKISMKKKNDAEPHLN